MGLADPAYVLMGIKHSGKTTLGAMLSHKLKVQLFDTDEIIAINYKMSVRSLYNIKGLAEFMQAEEKVCAFLQDKVQGKQCVIATGGGVCDNAPALNCLRTLGKFVFFKAPESVAINRILSSAEFTPAGIKNLPAFIAAKNPKNEDAVRSIFHDFYEERTRCYCLIADVIIPLEDAAPDVNFSKVIEALKI